LDENGETRRTKVRHAHAVSSGLCTNHAIDTSGGKDERIGNKKNGANRRPAFPVIDLQPAGPIRHRRPERPGRPDGRAILRAYPVSGIRFPASPTRFR
jgi:hypothetical protein